MKWKGGRVVAMDPGATACPVFRQLSTKPRDAPAVRGKEGRGRRGLYEYGVVLAAASSAHFQSMSQLASSSLPACMWRPKR